MKIIINRLILIALCFSVVTAEAARKKKPRFKPYQLVSNEVAEFSKIVTATRETITASKFKLVGEYAPYGNAQIFIITNDKLLEVASKSKFGGYGAVIRVAVTGVGENVQVSYVNSTYMSYLYQMGDLSEITTELENTFGASEPFGSKKGITKRSLKGYQYMMMMPEFDDHDRLAKLGSHKEAVDTVNKNLASGKHQLTKIFEVAIPGKDEVLIGVGIAEGDGADKELMSIIDSGNLKHTAYMPYAVLISGKKVYSQAGKFRIASSFPDLGMGTFMKISGAPGDIEDSLEKLTEQD